MVVAVGLGALLVLPALPASAKSISSSNLKGLTNDVNRGKKLTYYAQYTTYSSGQKSVVTIAQLPPKSNFSTSNSSIINTGRTTYYCSSNAGSASNSGNTGSSGSSESSSSTSSGSGVQCLAETGANPLLGIENVLSPAVILGAPTEAKQGLASRLLGIKVSSSSAAFSGQPSTCITVTVRGEGAKYCVTKQGLLSYSGTSGSSSSFQMTKYSSKPPASLFALPAGATTVTAPGDGNTP